MSKFHEMMMKKRDMKPAEKHAKLGVLKDLKDSLSDAMTDKMSASPHAMKKVSVMSDSPEGLSAGLDKAKQMASQGSDMDEDQMADGGMAGPNETDKATYSGTPHDDGFDYPNPNEAYLTGMPMTDHESKQDPEEPEHVTYDGSSDEKMGPGYYEGGEMGPNEVMPNEVTYSGHGEDYGAEHEDSDESEHGASYAEGGKVESPLDEAAESAEEERAETEGDAGDDDPPEFKGMNLQEVEEKLQHLLRMKRQMEKQ